MPPVGRLAQLWRAGRFRTIGVAVPVSPSRHDNQSWLGSLMAILDTCDLLMAGHPARRTDTRDLVK